jgi:branched-subunit amino acid transport protein
LSHITIILTLIGMGIVTYLTRVFFLVGKKDEVMPKFVIRALEFVPVAVLSAIVAPMVLAPEGKLALTYDSPYLIAGLLTFVVAFISRNLIITVFSGIVLILLVKFFVG